MTQDVAQPDPLVGQTVAGKYKIVKLLGEGGMGCVYLAEQQLGTSTRKVALKTLHKHLSHDPSIKARFNREAGTVAALEHPNTIQVFDFGEMPDGTLYLVMEFVQGRSVADILEKDGPMPPARVENILRQVCGSLEEAHGHGIVHRDLKPDNVVLCERAGQKDWVEVLDFGIAKRSSEHDPNEAKLTQQGMVLGTPPYMSPEQFTGQPIDLRSDIYALGVMAYEMLVGKYPFEANTAWEWASKHMTEPPRPIETQPLGPQVPEKMRQAITRALSKNREERQASVKQFFEEFATGAAGGTAVLGAANDAPAVSVRSGPGPEAPGRAKTEMAQPMMGGGPPAGAMTPPYGGPGPGAAPPISGGGAAIPVAQPRQEKKSGPPVGLIVGLLGAAGLIVILAVYFGVIRKSKPAPVVTTDLSTTNTTPSSSPDADAGVATNEDPNNVTPATPLGTPSGKTAANTSGGVPAKPSAKPVPTPKPSSGPATPTTPTTPAADPPVCAQARSAKQRGSPMAGRLEAQCIAAGGKL
jgi:serine/threonine-protein kinase